MRTVKSEQMAQQKSHNLSTHKCKLLDQVRYYHGMAETLIIEVSSSDLIKLCHISLNPSCNIHPHVPHNNLCMVVLYSALKCTPFPTYQQPIFT